jgi:hypothetical protein
VKPSWLQGSHGNNNDDDDKKRDAVAAVIAKVNMIVDYVFL